MMYTVTRFYEIKVKLFRRFCPLDHLKRPLTIQSCTAWKSADEVLENAQFLGDRKIIRTGCSNWTITAVTRYTRHTTEDRSNVGELMKITISQNEMQ